MFKKVWIITRPAEVQAFKVKAEDVEEFTKNKKVYKIASVMEAILQFLRQHLAKMQENCYYKHTKLPKEGVMK